MSGLGTRLWGQAPNRGDKGLGTGCNGRRGRSPKRGGWGTGSRGEGDRLQREEVGCVGGRWAPAGPGLSAQGSSWEDRAFALCARGGGSLPMLAPARSRCLSRSGVGPTFLHKRGHSRLFLVIRDRLQIGVCEHFVTGGGWVCWRAVGSRGTRPARAGKLVGG